MTRITKRELRDFIGTSETRSRWESGLDPLQNLYAMYLAPDWLEARLDSSGTTCQLLCAEDENGICEVVAAVKPAQIRLRFELSTALQKAVKIDGIELIGSQILGEASSERLGKVVAAIWREFPTASAIYCKSVQRGTPLWETLEQMNWRVGGGVAYRQHGLRPFHSVRLPATFEEYIAGFPSKQRYNLKKKVRRMAESVGGELLVRSVSHPRDVAFLIASARAIAVRSWRAKRLANPVPESIEDEALLRGIAERGLLRAFVLHAGDVPSAFIVGYLYRGVFHYADLAYDEDHSAHSPGTVLLYLTIEKLIEEDRARFINFGITDAQYKQVFGNQHAEEAEVLFMRPGVRNRALVSLHRVFQSAKSALKKRYRNRPSVE